MDNEVKLTDKQELFCIEYMKDFNAKQAAIRSGYSEDTAKQIGYENLTKPYLKARIDKLRNDLFAEKKANILDRVRWHENIVNASVSDFMHIQDGILIFKEESEIPKEKLAAIKEFYALGVNVIPRIQDPHKSMDMLHKIFGDFENDNKQKQPVTKIKIPRPTAKKRKDSIE